MQKYRVAGALGLSVLVRLHGGSSTIPEGPYTLPMELGPQKTIPIMVLGT